MSSRISTTLSQTSGLIADASSKRISLACLDHTQVATVWRVRIVSSFVGCVNNHYNRQ